MARLVLYALAALARAYDWTTPGQALTKFDCDAYPNPIQVFKADNQNPPYNVSCIEGVLVQRMYPGRLRPWLFTFLLAC